MHVDDRLRTDAPDVYAAGDVAEAADRMTGERYVHAIFPNAVAQGEVVARNILGIDTVLRRGGVDEQPQAPGHPDRVDRWDHWRRRCCAGSEGEALRTVWLTGGRIIGCRLAGDISRGRASTAC